jgi:TetR/AcrR family transcriptional repressor of nem operon
MPRPPSFSNDALTDRALEQFWGHGYNATSMDDLVRTTSVSRHGIYKTYGGKKQLFLACFERYQDIVVSPAFDVVEKDQAKFSHVGQYFEHQISSGEAMGLPGPGCFVANSATEVAPFDPDTMNEVRKHNVRLHQGFKNAITNEFASNSTLQKHDIEELAELMVVFTNGLWSRSRTVTDAGTLRTSAVRFLEMIKKAVK